MATYKELVQLTRLLSGMQGTGPSTVVAQQGIEEVLTRMVRDAYVDIQNRREEWNFLIRDKSITLQSGQDTYTLLQVFSTTAPLFKKYKKDSFIITNSDGQKNYLRYTERDVLEAQYLNDTVQKLPTQYAINPENNALIFKPIPDGVYTVTCRYYASPEILSVDAQVPILPASYHNAIAYLATAKMSIYLSSPENYHEYTRKAEGMIGELMRLEIPKKRMQQRPMV